MMKHAEKLIERILYLNGMPNVQRLGKVTIGETVAEQFELDRAVAEEAVPRLNDGIELCVDAQDNGTRALLEEILRSEEEHIDWLDAQQTLIKQVGLERYLSEQIG